MDAAVPAFRPDSELVKAGEAAIRLQLQPMIAATAAAQAVAEAAAARAAAVAAAAGISAAGMPAEQEGRNARATVFIDLTAEDIGEEYSAK